MSTNDTVLVLANGRAGNPALTARSADLGIFQAALDHVTLELAKKIVLDGEGVSRFVTVRLQGAKTEADADAAARAVANSLLVKTSWCGGDPNWGRILCALGYSSAAVVETGVDVGYSLPGSQEDSVLPQMGPSHERLLQGLVPDYDGKAIRPAHPFAPGQSPRLDLFRRPDRSLCGFQQRRYQ